MKKQSLLVIMLTAIMLSGSLIANADNSSESINSTAQQSPDKRAGQPTSADTNTKSSVNNNSLSEATIESSTESYNSSGSQDDSNSSKSSVIQYHHSGGESESNEGSVTTTPAPSYSYSSSGVTSEHVITTTETSHDRTENAREHMTDAQRRQKTRKAKIALAQATLKYEAAKKQYDHEFSDQNKAKLRSAVKSMNSAHAALLKILI